MSIETLHPDFILPPLQTYFRAWQDRVCQIIEKEDGEEKFQEDSWQHPSGGGGLTRVLSGGACIEKAGVNFSHVRGLQLPQAATQKRPFLDAAQFQVSLWLFIRSILTFRLRMPMCVLFW